MPPKKMRFIRIGDELWCAATKVAHARNTNVSTVVRELLADYVARWLEPDDRDSFYERVSNDG